MNRVKIVVCGKEYILKTEEPSAYIYGLAKNLEKRINEITDATGASPYNAAIMVGLSALDEISKAETTIDSIRDQIKVYVDAAGKARIERDAVLKENEVLKNKLEQLESALKLKKLSESLSS